MATPAQPLYSLDRDSFKTAVSSFASRAFPGSTVGFREDPDNGSLVPLRKLPEALASSGPAGSCPGCNLNVLEGIMADVCLACGAKSYSAGLSAQLAWSGSLVQQRFLQAIPCKPRKNKRRSAQQYSSTPVISPSSNFLDGPFDTPSPLPLSGPSSTMFKPAGAPGGITSPDSPWDASLDMGAGNQMNVFSLADAAVEMEKFSSQSGRTTRDANPLDDLFAQLGSAPAAASQDQGLQEASKTAGAVNPAVQAVLAGLPDLSFLLADHLAIPEKDPGRFPPSLPQAPAPASAASQQSMAYSVAPAVPVVSPVAPVPDLVPSKEEDQDDEWGDFET